MTDIRLAWDAAGFTGDVEVAANDLAPDAGLETAVFMSLFSDRRLDDSDDLPDGATDRRGWWADTQDDRIGSKLWTLSRSKQTPAVLGQIEAYAREALEWLVTDRIASSVDVSAISGAMGVWELAVTVRRPAADPALYRYSYTWASQEARRIT